MARVLMVQSPFGGRARGDMIEDADEVAAVLAGENAGHCVSFDRADPPAEQQEGG